MLFSPGVVHQGSCFLFVKAWLSGVDLDVTNSENINIRRWDVLLGNPGRGVHAIMWGKVNTATEELNMYLGVPAGALARAGTVVSSLPQLLSLQFHLFHSYLFVK